MSLGTAGRALRIAIAMVALMPTHAWGEKDALTTFQAVPELPYQVVPGFFKMPEGAVAGEASGVAVNSKGHIFLFQRTEPMLSEYDAKGVLCGVLERALYAPARPANRRRGQYLDHGRRQSRGAEAGPVGEGVAGAGEDSHGGRGGLAVQSACRRSVRKEWRDLRCRWLWQLAHCEI